MKIAKVVGLNSDNEAAQALTSSNQQGLELILLINCQLEDAFTRSRNALSEAENSFYLSSNETDLSQRLKEVLESLKSALIDAENLSILVSCIEENPNGSKVLYLMLVGVGLFCQVIREGKTLDLTQLSQDGELASGFLKPDDRVILATRSLMEILKEDFQKVINVEITNFEDEVAAFLPQSQILPLAAVVMEEEKVTKLDQAPKVETVVSKPVFKAPNLLPVISKAIPRSRRGLTVIGLFLLVVVLVGIGITYKNQKQSQQNSQFKSHLDKATSSYQEALTLKELDPTLSNQRLSEAKDSLKLALELSPEDSEALRLQQTINESSNLLLNIYQIAEIPVWLDLDLVKKDLKSDFLAYSLGKVLVYDSSKNTLVLLDTTTKSQQVLPVDKISGGKNIGLNGELAFVSGESGVVKVDSVSNDSEVVIKSDEEWGVIKDIYAFAGNVYLLDSLKNQIWKYLPIQSGYSEKRTYLTEDTSPDFSSAKRLQIDSSVWVLNSDGEVLKFTQGVRDHFVISNLDKDFQNPKSFFISDTADDIYILDSGNNRVVILTKTGAYKAQYISNQLGNVTDLVVDEENKKVYLIDSSKIYLLDLK